MFLKKQQLNNMKENGHKIIRRLGLATIGTGSLIAGLGVAESISYDIPKGILLATTGVSTVGIGVGEITIANIVDPYRRRRNEFCEDAIFMFGTRIDIPDVPQADPKFIDAEYKIIE